MRAIINLRLEREAGLSMITKKRSKRDVFRAVFGAFFVMIGLFAGVFGTVLTSNVVYADPETSETDTGNNENDGNNDNNEATEEAGNETNDGNAESNTVATNSCKDSLGEIGWLVCPTTGKVAEAVDWLYDKIEDVLKIEPVSTEDGSPIYEIWKYCLSLTNIVFIIFLLVVIYSQITGVGISNYGIKKALPKLIVTAILVNLSFLICSLAVDVSNIVGNGLRGVFTAVQESVVAGNAAGMTAETAIEAKIAYAKSYAEAAGGIGLAAIAGVVALETGAIWMLIPVVLGAIVAVVTGLITIALRQAVVALLIMIAPLAIVAYILPNTEKWFKKWKDLLIKMLVFYPMFSLLFGASSLAGFAIAASAKDGFGVLLGIAVQVFPLFFSWKLMQMSGTFLGTINAKMNGMAARPLAASRTWAGMRRAQTSAYFLQYGRTPFSQLRKRVDNKKELRKRHLESLQKIRQNEAEIYVQRKIGAGYDGTKAQGTEAFLKPNKYTRVAKDLSNSNLASETARMDTEHVISNYSNYFVSRDVRDKVKAATKAKDEAALENIRRTDAEYRRSMEGATNYLEYNRAQMTAENDAEADFNFMVGEYLNATINRDNGQMEKYRHYIESSAGGLGEIGQTRVLGKIIAKAASVESNQRRDINIIANKFPPDKRSFRNMTVGYYVDDDGYATDKEGNRIEEIRGWLLQNDPNKLVLWDQVDDNGPFFEWKDTNGNFVTKIYKSDKSAIKELLSNFDAPINDPINNLYGILAGIKEGDIKGTDERLKYIGLDAYRTTVGRALLSAPFKEKNAAFSPMVKEMVAKGYIQNYAQEYLAYLDSLNKATKPGAFNVQDSDAIDVFCAMMDPDRWEEIFPTELIRGYRNINGEPIYGIRRDENGNKVKVPAEEATREELMERVKEKYIIPAAHKITMMMSRQTPNTADNQKAGTVEKWKKLKEIFDTKWGGGVLDDDPYQQVDDMRKIARDVQQSLYTIDENGTRVQINRRGRQQGGGGRQGMPRHVNHHVVVEEMHINSNNDPDEFARNFAEYCDAYPELARAKRDFNDFVADRGYMVTEHELYEFAVELLDSYTNLD